jgi:hypothetical protein
MHGQNGAPDGLSLSGCFLGIVLGWMLPASIDTWIKWMTLAVLVSTLAYNIVKILTISRRK